MSDDITSLSLTHELSLYMTPDDYDLLTLYLKHLYEVSVYQRHEIAHPIFVYYPNAEQVNDVDSLMGGLNPRTLTQFPIYDYAFLHTLQNSGRHLYNGKTYALHYIETDPLTVHGQFGNYYDMLATCGALENELKANMGHLTVQLPNRTQLHRHLNLSQTIWSGMGRCATIGGACLVVFNDQGTYKAILAQRSSRNATDPNFYHVMPAFIFQPTTDAPDDREWKISHHIYREYLEELFGVSEDAERDMDWIYEHPALVSLQHLMHQGLASLHLTGVTVNLMTLRPEICTMLLIKDPQWWETVNNPDNPHGLNAHSEAEGGRLATVPIASDEALLASLPDALHTKMPPQGFVAMWLGVDLARQRIGED